MNELKEQNDLLIYKDKDGNIVVDAIFKDETLWLTQKSMAKVFSVDRTVITKHLKNIFKDEELIKEQVCAKIAHTAEDGKTYNTELYNLDAIIAVGYRVNSKKATEFRIWATKRLHEYIQKGFALDDDRLKQGDNRYFRELLQRIRDIHSSERNFYQQVTDIYATSIDYDPRSYITKKFFATVQNKLHYAVHEHTAAELIHERVDIMKFNKIWSAMLTKLN